MTRGQRAGLLALTALPGGVLAVMLLAVVSVAAWLPVAQEHQDQDQEQEEEISAGGPGTLAPGAVPEEYRALVEEWGSYCPALSPPLLAAQLEHESGWQPRAVSPAGAQGLGQFMPGTWASYGTDGNGDGRADVWDPADAIASAAVYDCALARQVAGVPGDPVDNMLAAYNAGPGTVLRYGGVPPRSFAGGETYHYVRAIRARAAEMTAASPRQEEAPSGEAARIVYYARQEIGTPYSWGGGGPSGPTTGIQHGAGTVGYDCSGLTQYAVYQATDGRITLPRTSQTQRGAGTQVDSGQGDRVLARGSMRPGDIIVIDHDGAWGHVGIYAGNGMMIHAPRTGRTVEETALAGYWGDFEWDVRRVV